MHTPPQEQKIELDTLKAKSARLRQCQGLGEKVKTSNADPLKTKFSWTSSKQCRTAAAGQNASSSGRCLRLKRLTTHEC
jgi:hypothetical protein